MLTVRSPAVETREKQDLAERLESLAVELCASLKLKEKSHVLKGLSSADHTFSQNVNAHVEKFAKSHDVPARLWGKLKQEVIKALKQEIEEEKQKNKEANIKTLREETEGKVKALLEKKGRISIEENADAIIEQLKSDEMVKVRVLEYLRAEYEPKYEIPKNAWYISNEEQESKAKQVVKRLLVLNDGKVAKAVYKKLKEGEPDRYESIERMQKRILKELGLEKAFAAVETAMEPALKAKGEFNRKLEAADKLLDELKKRPESAEKEKARKKIEQLTQEVKAAMSSIVEELPKIRRSIDALGQEINKKSPEKFDANQQFILESFDDAHERLRALGKPSYGSFRSIEQQYGELYGKVLGLSPFEEKAEKISPETHQRLLGRAQEIASKMSNKNKQALLKTTKSQATKALEKYLEGKGETILAKDKSALFEYFFGVLKNEVQQEKKSMATWEEKVKPKEREETQESITEIAQTNEPEKTKKNAKLTLKQIDEFGDLSDEERLEIKLHLRNFLQKDFGDVPETFKGQEFPQAKEIAQKIHKRLWLGSPRKGLALARAVYDLLKGEGAETTTIKSAEAIKLLKTDADIINALRENINTTKKKQPSTPPTTPPENIPRPTKPPIPPQRIEVKKRTPDQPKIATALPGTEANITQKETTPETKITEKQKGFIAQAKRLLDQGRIMPAITALRKELGDFDYYHGYGLELIDAMRSAASVEACYQAAQTLLEKIHKNK